MDRERIDDRIRLERALLKRVSAGTGITRLPRPPGDLRFPAAVSQEGMWAEIVRSNGAAGSIVSGLRLRGPLRLDLLEQAWNAVIARHETLRTGFEHENGRLFQVIREHVAVRLSVTDLDLADLEAAVHRKVDEPFPLDRPPLARLSLFRLAENDHVAVLLLQHLIGEARSLEVIVRDLAAHYDALVAGRICRLEPLPVQWADFAAWHRERLGGRWGDTLVAYWRERLSGARPVVLARDAEPGTGDARLGGMHVVRLPAELYRRLIRFARSHRSTLYTVGLAAFMTLLSRESGQTDIALNAPVSYRNRSDLTDLVADFSGDVIVRADLSGGPSFRTLVAELTERVALDFAHPDLPPHLLVPHLDEPGLVERIAAIQFTTERELDVLVRTGGLCAERFDVARQYALRPLSVRMRYDDDGAVCQVRFRTAEYSAGRMRALVDSYLDVLDEMTRRPESPVLRPGAVGTSPDCATYPSR